MKKIYFLASLAALALASCSNEEFDDSASTSASNAIGFGTSYAVKTRAGLEDATSGLGSTATFKVYGTKTDKSSPAVTQTVFPNYVVTHGSANTDVTDVAEWSYLKTSGQTVKYWDYAADHYDFYAAAPSGIGTISTATTGWTLTVPSDGKFFITDKTTQTVADDMSKTVTLSFRNGKAILKLGIFETIPGYAVKNVKFYVNTTEQSNATLAGTVKNPKTYTVTYASDGKALLTATDFNTASTSVSFGTLSLATSATHGLDKTATTDYLATTSNAASMGSETASVFPVDADNAQPLTLKVDYTLYSLDTDETITVHGATASVPAEYTAWQANYAYTYLFKISDKTNGKTYSSASCPEGLYPITFDAVIADAQTGEQGTITSVASVSFTTYQVGSVTTTGVKYNHGTAIYATVEGDGTESLTLTDKIKVYSLGTTEKTEADLLVTAPTSEVTATIGNAAATVGSVIFKANQYCSFTPTTAGYYAIQYLVSAAVNYTQAEIDAASEGDAAYGKTTSDVKTPAVYAYKVVHVE